MQEDIVRHAMLKYLEVQGKQPRRRARQASGPDILVEGTAIEVKGSPIDERSLLKQLAIYLHDFSMVELAIPSDAFSIALLYKIQALEQLSRKDGSERSIRLYFVAATDARWCWILEVGSATLALTRVSQLLYGISKKNVKEMPESKADLAFRIEDEIRKEMNRLVLREGRQLFV